jgi:hypothetical protein
VPLPDPKGQVTKKRRNGYTTMTRILTGTLIQSIGRFDSRNPLGVQRLTLREENFMPPLSNKAALSLLMLAMLLINGCGGGMAPTPMQAGPTASFAFIANSEAGNVSAFAIDTSGALFSVPGSPFPAGAGAEFMALDPAHGLLFVANQDANNISAFSVDTNSGLLTPVPGSPFPAGAMLTASPWIRRESSSLSAIKPTTVFPSL